MFKTKTALIIVVILFNVKSFSQLLSGQIINFNKEPLQDVYVYNITSNSHTHTNINGNFVLENTKVNDIIEISILGYKKQKLTLNEFHFKNKMLLVLETKTFLLDELVLTKKINPIHSIVKIDLAKSPVNSSQDILQKVPGLFIGQHAGGGKAEQIFLRGFDIDHGTDLSLSVDGLPVNMVSHAHGQGYSDLHFVIPETIQKIDFGKGPYYANHGDFNTAGYVDFKTKNIINKSNVSLSVGQFNTFRALGLFDLLGNKTNENAYAAIEYLSSDVFFESSQNFRRINLFSKYSKYLDDNSKITLTASHFTSKWDASGQIPQREVDNGNISRFGAIDDTEGGETSRTNLNLEFNKTLNAETAIQTNVFYTKYNFELFSNFTFFLEDPIYGDQIKQKENRDIFGFNTQFIKDITIFNNNAKVTLGTGLRNDIVKNVELSHTLNRKVTLNNIQLGDVNQTNFYTFLNTKLELGNFTIEPGLRLDYFNFQYNDALQSSYETQSSSKTIINPKLNFTYTPNTNVQWFIKSGIGFHSNDARVVVQQTNKTLPRAYGLDFGNSWKPTSKLIINTTLWYLLSEEEFVYVGDAGIVEPSGESQRYGLDIGLRYQFTNWLYFNSDATFTKARSLEEIEGQNYIPLAPKNTLAGGLSVDNYKNFSGGIQYRYIDDRPANEDNTIVAEGYFVTNANVNYKFKNITVGVSVENLFDVEWNETQFATESRLRNESNPVEEIHFTPGTPFSAKMTLQYSF